MIILSTKQKCLDLRSDVRFEICSDPVQLQMSCFRNKLCFGNTFKISSGDFVVFIFQFRTFGAKMTTIWCLILRKDDKFVIWNSSRCRYMSYTCVYTFSFYDGQWSSITAKKIQWLSIKKLLEGLFFTFLLAQLLSDSIYRLLWWIKSPQLFIFHVTLKRALRKKNINSISKVLEDKWVEQWKENHL